MKGLGCIWGEEAERGRKCDGEFAHVFTGFMYVERLWAVVGAGICLCLVWILGI